MMRSYILSFNLLILSILVILSVSAPVFANEASYDVYFLYRVQNIGDGFVPPADETIQYLWDDLMGRTTLRESFQERWYTGSLIRALKKNIPLLRIANEIDEIPCGQHHRFALVVFGGEKQEVFWHSSRPDIVQINEKTGEMTAMGEGDVRIWVTDGFGKIKDTTCMKVTPKITKEEENMLYGIGTYFEHEGMVYWDDEKLRLTENAYMFVHCYWGSEKVQARIPASVRALTYDISFEDDWGIRRGEDVTVSVDGNNRNYYSLFGVLFSHAFEYLEEPELTSFEVQYMCMADCKYRALLLYPPNRKNEVYYVPDGVERIAGRAFEGAKYLRKVVVSDTVRAIGPDAFLDCYNLEEIVIPESVVEFEDNGYVDAIDAKPEVVAMGLKAKITIVTPKGSAAEAYAIEHGIAYRNE